LTVADQGMAVALRALRGVAGLPVLDRAGLREPAERALYQLTKNGFRAAGTAGRTFARVQRAGRPARQRTGIRTDLFDLSPTDEQQMITEALRDFAAARLRPVAQDADTACAPPESLAGEAAELGLASLGVPEELGGAMSERSSVTGVLAAEALAQGDMGLAVSLLAPAGVATALARFGDATQQATYLPAFTGDSPAPAAVAVLERGALFDPFALQTTARRTDGGWTIDGEKALVPLASTAELLLVAAETGEGPALFVVETSSDGVDYQPEPAMGVRAAATGVVALRGVAVGEDALLCRGADYAEAITRSRLAWCALAAGCSLAVLDHVIPYVNERQAFGEPISHRQAVAFAVADMAIEVEGMRLTTYRAASLLDQEKDAAHATTIARRLCADKGMVVGSQGVQLLGGHGYVKEYPVERWYRDLRATAVMEGAVMV
jgi:alkylation response protein AidB-like acyl-CoA dehydrogenase